MEVKEYSPRKEQIIRVAAGLFNTQGYKGATMRGLATLVKLEAASLYSHISSKEQLLVEICMAKAEDFFVAIKPVMNSKVAADKKLENAIKAHLTVIVTDIDASAVFFHEWRNLTNPHLQSFRELRQKYENLFRDILREGKESGLFRIQNEKYAVLTIFSAMNWTTEWYRPDSQMDIATIAKEIAQIILRGISSEAQKTQA